MGASWRSLGSLWRQLSAIIEAKRLPKTELKRIPNRVPEATRAQQAQISEERRFWEGQMTQMIARLQALELENREMRETYSQREAGFQQTAQPKKSTQGICNNRKNHG